MFEIVFPFWDIIIKIVLNTLLVSIPEEIFLVMLTLILLGEFDYWKEEECRKIINRWDYSRILIPSVTVALLSNIATYVNINTTLACLVCTLILWGLIVYTNDVLGDARPFKWMVKAFILLIIAEITLGIIEMLYVPVLLNSTGQTISDINSNILINFTVSLPARLIQFLIIAFFVNKKRTLIKGNLIRYLVKNPVISILLSLVIVFDVLFLHVMYRAIVYGKLLVGLSLMFQILVLVGTILFPLLNIAALIWALYYNENKEMLERRNIKLKLEVLLEEINAYKDNENFSNVRWKLNEISMVIDEITDDINIGKRGKK